MCVWLGQYVSTVTLFLWELLPLIYINWIQFRRWLRSCVAPLFSFLASRCNASFIGMLCKLLDLLCQGPLQKFCPVLTSVIHAYSFRHVMDDSFFIAPTGKI